MYFKKQTSIVATIVVLSILGGAVYLWAFHPFLKSNGIAHVSIDDVTISLQNLTKDSTKYRSIFEEPFFAYLKDMHDNYDCSFTCYAYESDKDFNVNLIPDKYKAEFETNNDWLKFGYHGIKPSNHKPYNVGYTQFTKSFVRFNKEIERFASKKSQASILRLDYYYATPQELEFLATHGVSTLLSADDDRRSYNLPTIKNRKLIENNSIHYDGLKFLRTNIRIENIDFPYINILRNKNKDTLVVFTHEWKLDKLNKYKLRRTIKILKEQNYKFISE